MFQKFEARVRKGPRNHAYCGYTTVGLYLPCSALAGLYLGDGCRAVSHLLRYPKALTPTILRTSMALLNYYYGRHNRRSQRKGMKLRKRCTSSYVLSPYKATPALSWLLDLQHDVISQLLDQRKSLKIAYHFKNRAAACHLQA